MKPPKKLPSILALLLLAAATIILTWLTGSARFFFSKASPVGDNCQPLGLQITNLTHGSVDISFTTASACTSSLDFNGKSYPNHQNSSFSHYFSIFALEPQTNYLFSLTVNGKHFSSESYNLTTPPRPGGDTPNSNLAWGKVKNPDNSPAQNSIIYLNVPNASPLSALVTANGNWNISLATSLNLAQNEWFTPPTNIPEEIIVISPNGTFTQVTGNTSRNNPVPDIIIGQDQLNPVVLSDTGSLDLSNPGNPSLVLEIYNPKDNDAIFTQRPQFFGQAPAGSRVIISLHSDTVFEDQASVDDQGRWLWTPPQDISLGEHQITAKVQDPQTGLWKTITHNFTVYASAEGQLAFSSSPSGNIATPTTVLPPTNTLAPQATPTLAAKATAAATSTPKTVKPATDSGVPITGVALPTILTLTFALMLSFAFILFTRL